MSLHACIYARARDATQPTKLFFAGGMIPVLKAKVADFMLLSQYNQSTHNISSLQS